MATRVENQLKSLPAKPGVYLFRDADGEVLYVGKAKSLRPRVRSYFQRTTDGRPQIQSLPGPRRGRRGDRDGQRGRGAPSRAEPRQAAPASVQRPPARRQVVPLYRRHGRGRVPAGDVHARATPARRLVLRAVREREEGARDARCPQPRLPLSGRARGRSRAGTAASRASTSTSTAASRRASATCRKRTTAASSTV